MIMEITQLAQGVGGIATAASVAWAIYTYKNTRESSELIKARHALDSVVKTISEIDGYLSQPEFTALGDEIAKELISLKSENESPYQFAVAISSQDNHDFVARAIHLGRVNSKATEKFRDRLSSLDYQNTDIANRLPVTAFALKCIAFYIRQTTSLISSPRIFDMVLGNHEAMNKHLLPKINEDASIQQLRAHLGLLAAACPANVLSLPIGQQLFDEAEKAIGIVAKSIQELTDSEIKALSRKEISLEKKLKDIDLETSADDAIESLKGIKHIFAEDKWDDLVTAKANIIMLTANKNGQQGDEADA